MNSDPNPIVIERYISWRVPKDGPRDGGGPVCKSRTPSDPRWRFQWWPLEQARDTLRKAGYASPVADEILESMRHDGLEIDLTVRLQDLHPAVRKHIQVTL